MKVTNERTHTRVRTALALAATVACIALPLSVAQAAEPTMTGTSTVTATPNPALLGEDIALNFTTSVTPDPTEMVRFEADGNLVHEEVFDGGNVTTTWTPTEVGSYHIIATIVDADGVETQATAATDAQVVIDDPSATHLSLQATPTSVLVDENVKLTATIDRVAKAGDVVHFTTDDGKISEDVAFVPGRSSVSLTVQPTEVREYVVDAVLIDSTGVRTTAEASEIVKVEKKAAIVTVKAPGTAVANTKVTLQANIASNGAGLPFGTVDFYGVFTPTGSSAQAEVKVGSANVDQATGVAKYDVVTPNKNGSWVISAKYSGDKTHSPATSAVSDKIVVTGSTSDVTITLTAPATAYVGTSTSLTAVVKPTTSTGKVTFYADGKALTSTTGSNPVTLSGGYATFAWKPDTVGDFKMTVKFESTDGVTSASATDVVTKVSASKVVDTITLKTSSGQSLTTTAALTMTKGQSVDLIATAKSGAKVTLTATGECDLEGTQLTAIAAGSCAVKAVSPGADAYATVTSTYPVSVKTTTNGGGSTNGGSSNGGADNGGSTTTLPAQTAKLTAAATTKPVVKGKSIVLAAKPVKTTQGKAIAWKTTTPKMCKVATSKAGKSVMTATAAGKCVIVASAPAVAGKYAAYSKTLTYTIKK